MLAALCKCKINVIASYKLSSEVKKLYSCKQAIVAI